MTNTLDRRALLATVSEPLKRRLRDRVRESLYDALICTRHWDAWVVGTMSADDFVLASEEDEFVEELVDAVLNELLNDMPS